MKLHIQRTVAERVVVDQHCCIELQTSRNRGALYNSRFLLEQSEIYLGKTIPDHRGAVLLKMKFCCYCGTKFSTTDIGEEPIKVTIECE